MSRIDELIAEHCPHGVQFRTLGSLGKRNKGTPITAAKMKILALVPGPIRVFAGGQTIADVAEDAVPSKNIVRVPSIIVKSRGHIGFTFYEKPFTHKSELWSYSIDHSDVDQKFVFYYLLTQVSKLQEIARATSVKLPQLGVKDTDTLKVPVPPLEIQREIVRILDTFSKMEAELEAELEARRRQYSFYRDSLLTFTERGRELRWLQMSDVAVIVRGASPRPIRSFLTNDSDGISWIKIGDVPSNGKFVTSSAEKITQAGALKSRMISPGDFILSNSMSFGRPYISKISGCIHDGWLAISGFSEFFVPDFLYHLLRSTPIQQELKRLAGNCGSVSNLNADIVRNLVVPVPSIDEQKRTVEILDKFEVLVNDLSVGLPAELNVRRQQYEYYRDKLLTFKELKPAS